MWVVAVISVVRVAAVVGLTLTAHEVVVDATGFTAISTVVFCTGGRRIVRPINNNVGVLEAQARLAHLRILTLKLSTSPKPCVRKSLGVPPDEICHVPGINNFDDKQIR